MAVTRENKNFVELHGKTVALIWREGIVERIFTGVLDLLTVGGGGLGIITAGNQQVNFKFYDVDHIQGPIILDAQLRGKPRVEIHKLCAHINQVNNRTVIDLGPEGTELDSGDPGDRFKMTKMSSDQPAQMASVA